MRTQQTRNIMKKINPLLFNQGGKCFFCNAILDIKEASIDHIIPQSKGGTDDIDNLVVCCKYANQAFRDYSPKHKMTVIKEIFTASFSCQNIFPRENSCVAKKVVEKLDISIAYQLLIKTVKSTGNDTLSSQVKAQMLKLSPSFKESDYGFNQFNQFLLDAQENKIIHLKKTTGNNYLVTQPIEKNNQTAKKQNLSIVYQLLQKALESMENNVASSQVKNKMLTLKPSFKESDYGFNQFNQFLLHAQENNIIHLQNTTGNNYLVNQLIKKNKKTAEKPNISIAYQLLHKALETMENDAVSSQVKNKMLILKPSFKESDYGFNRFYKFLLHAQENKIIHLKKTKGNNYLVTHQKNK